MINRGTIYLLGDGILDNFFWLEDQKSDLAHELEKLEYTVKNYAADKTRVSDLTSGIALDPSHIKYRSYPYPTEEDGKVYPLRLLARDSSVKRAFTPVYAGINPIGHDDGGSPTAILSVGGNDLRVATSNIVFGFDYYVNSVLTPKFSAEYESVIAATLHSCSRLILVSIYYPYMGPGSSYSKYSRFTGRMLTRWLQFLKGMAVKYNVPILDLSRTLDRDNRLHYGTNETEPSNLSTKCIARCLAHIQSNYVGHKVYFAPNCDHNKMQTE